MAGRNTHQGRTSTSTTAMAMAMAMASDATKSGRNFGFKRKPCSIPKALLRSTGLRGSRFLSPSQSPSQSQSQSNTSNGPKPKAEQEAPQTMTATPSKAFPERYSVEGRTKTKTKTQGRVFSFLLPHECDRVNGNGNGNGNGNSDSTKTSPRSTLSSSSSLTSESSFGTSSGNSSNTSSNNNNNNNTNDDANLGDSDSDVSASGDANYTGDHPDHSSSSSFKEGFISDDDDKDNDDNDDKDDAKDKNKDRVPNESVNGLGLDFSIARSRIADEAASEALVRWGSREFCTVVSIGKGSSQADRILARDRRPIWQQGGCGCGDCGCCCCCCKARKGDDETEEHGHLHGPHSGGDVLLAPAPDHQTSAHSIPSSIAGIAERAAASAFARQKQRKESIDEAQAKSQLLADHHGHLGFFNGFEEKENNSASVDPLGVVRDALARDKDSEKIGSTTDSVSLLPTFIYGDKGTEVIAEESLGDKEHDDPSATGDDRELLVDAEAEEEERPKTVVLTNRLGVAAGLAVPTESDSFGIEVVEPLRQTATSDNDCDANNGPAIILVNTVFCKNMLQDPGSSNSRTSKIRCHGGNSNKDTDNEEVCWEDIMDSDASVDGSRVAARPPPALSSSSPTRIFVAFAKVVGHMSSKLIGIRQMKEAEENTAAN